MSRAAAAKVQLVELAAETEVGELDRRRLALTRRVDVVIVVGAPESSNSNRLVELAEKSGIRAYLVQCADDIEPSWLDGMGRVGVTAGASAPDVLVSQVTERLEARSHVTDLRAFRIERRQKIDTHRLFPAASYIRVPTR